MIQVLKGIGFALLFIVYVIVISLGEKRNNRKQRKRPKQ